MASTRGFHMPAEWSAHRRTWMAWPVAETVLEGTGGADGAYRAWAAVANAIAGFEPVVMLAPPGGKAQARGYLEAGVEVVEHDIAESWMRDFGPTFVLGPEGRLGAVDWTFNGWGGRTFPDNKVDALIARFVAERAGAERFASRLVNEGGAIHVDGEGTVMLTESVQLNANRNPNWTKAEVEAEIHALLGTRTAIWLKQGLESDCDDTGTDGHVDTLACFLRPGLVLAHRQPDPAHPDYDIARENIATLKAARDAAGRTLDVIEIDAPAQRFKANGEPLSCTYVNFSFVNGGVVLCGFDDPKDEAVAEMFSRLFNDRRVVQVPATRIFEGGGGIHCITQQEPLARAG
ncbi:agmatine deiminase family protein [Microbaculum sp. FT89]|uniref:agmatine deiminase family protein n=1 Tax=Microbaculum sp. FT89 TaxID=3447298 RepID=UPI003F52B70B